MLPKGRRLDRTLSLPCLCTTVFRRCALVFAAAVCPYPDDGEFLAGVVYAQNFLTGVKTIDRLRAVGKGRGDWPQIPYTVFATTRSADTTAKVSSTDRMARRCRQPRRFGPMASAIRWR